MQRRAPVGRHRFAESYIGRLDHAPPPDLLKLFVANRQQVEGVIYGTWPGLLYRIKHLLNRNTRSNSQKNIHAHYDLGNASNELWLDDTDELFVRLVRRRRGGDMRTAQHSKVRRALRMAGVQLVTVCWIGAAGAHWLKWRPPSSARR